MMPDALRPYARILRLAALAAAAMAIAALLPPGSSGAEKVVAPQDACRHAAGAKQNRYEHCEVRGFEFAPPAPGLRVDGGLNGGVSVAGDERANVRVEAQVQTWAKTAAEAKQVAEAVEIHLPERGGAVTAEGPGQRQDQGWAVSYRVFVPKSADLDLKTQNGGVSIHDVTGRLRFDVVNGGVDLRRTAGDVQGHTVNGGLSIELTGTKWTGAGLDARTANGGVQVTVPRGYNAELRAEAVNGKLRFDLPGSTEANIRGQFTTTLGAGGPAIHVATTNGGVRVAAR